MRKLRHEPLVHFLLLGFGLFVLHRWVAGPPAGGDRIVITQGRIEQLVAGYERMHQRAPLRAELDGMIADAVREEVLYREAMAMGLDKDDTIVRRRLRQKLEFLTQDVSPVPEPSDAQLLEHLRANHARYSTARTYSLVHVYLDPRKHAARMQEDAARLLASLRRAGNAGAKNGEGDAFLLPRRYDRIPSAEVSRLFGTRFEATLREIPVGAWQGPVQSGFGYHLVYLEANEAGRLPALRDVRASVRADWIGAQRLRANEEFYAGLRKRYAVTVERAAAIPGGSAAVAAAGSR